MDAFLGNGGVRINETSLCQHGIEKKIKSMMLQRDWEI